MYRDVEADRTTYPAPFEVCPFCGQVFVTATLMRTGPYCARCRESDPNKPTGLSVMPYAAHDIDAAQERPACIAEVVGRLGLTGAVVVLTIPVAVLSLMAVAVGFAAWLLIPHRDREALGC